MTIRANQGEKRYSNPGTHTTADFSCEDSCHTRINPDTGKVDYYFPLEITDPSIRTLAKEQGLEICKARLGLRVFEAVMVPCKEIATIHGREVYIDTPSEVQHRRYLDLIKDELDWQENLGQEGGCLILNGHDGIKRCPCRIPNPNYAPGGDKPKTLPVQCEGCKYELLRHAHSTIALSAFDHEDESGEAEPYEIPATRTCYAGDRYCELSGRFVLFVKERYPKLVPLAKLLVAEYSESEASEQLNKAVSIIGSQAKKLRELLEDFLETSIDF